MLRQFDTIAPVGKVALEHFRGFVLPTQRLGIIFLLLTALSFVGIFEPALGALFIMADILLIGIAVFEAAGLPRGHWLSATRETRTAWEVDDPDTVNIIWKPVKKNGHTLAWVDGPPRSCEPLTPAEGSLSLAESRAHRSVYQVTPQQRGVHGFGKLYSRVQGRWGLTQRQDVFYTPQDVKIYPALPDNIGSFQVARRLAGHRGAHAIRRIGISGDFDSLRPFHVGDDARLIDWKATARRGDLITRQYTLERDQSLMICLDAGREMLGSEAGMARIEWALKGVLTLAAEAIEVGDRVGMAVFGTGRQELLPPATGLQQFRHIREMLFDVQPSYIEADLETGMTQLRKALRKRSLIILLTDVADAGAGENLSTAMTGLLGRHMFVVAALRDPDLDAEAGGEPQNTKEAVSNIFAGEHLRERQHALSRLSGRGVYVLDVPAKDLSLSLLNKYLEIKRRGLL